MNEKKRNELMDEYRALPRTKASDLDRYKASRAVVYEQTPQKRRWNKKALFGSLVAVVAVALIVPLLYFLINGNSASKDALYDQADSSTNPGVSSPPADKSDSRPSSENSLSPIRNDSKTTESEALRYLAEEDVVFVESAASEYLGTASEIRLTSSDELVGYRYRFTGEDADATVTVYVGDVRLYEDSFPAALTSVYRGERDVRYSSEYSDAPEESKPYRYTLLFRENGREVAIEADCVAAQTPDTLIERLKR